MSTENPCWDFERNYIKLIDQFGENLPLHSVESSYSWTWCVLVFVQIFFDFFHQFCGFHTMSLIQVLSGLQLSISFSLAWLGMVLCFNFGTTYSFLYMEMLLTFVCLSYILETCQTQVTLEVAFVVDALEFST